MGMFEQPTAQRMTGFVIGNDLLLSWSYQFVLFLQSSHHTIDGRGEIFHFNNFLVLSGSMQRGFVAGIGDLGAGKSRSLFCQPPRINISSERKFFNMNFKDGLPLV